MAHRICLEGGFSDDPEAWLDSISDRAFANWVAFYDVEPWGNDYLRDAKVCELLSAQFAATTARGGGKYECQSLEHYMPPSWAYGNRNKRKGKISLAGLKDSQKEMAQRYGKK